MINAKHLLKVASAWITVVYIICFAGVAIFPASRGLFMKYALHTKFDMGQDVISVATFISGLIVWNIIALLVVWLFSALFNKIKQ